MQKEQEKFAQGGHGRKTSQGRVESHAGLMVLRIKDRKDVTVLSTAQSTAKNPCTDKFEVDEMYNRRKSLVDQTDQKAAISPFLRRTNKW
ncbi:hypothetical protein KIN20_019967 [Parelaphostrongylus tenuis]|uniref:Uncharacterized protein n=1 Tax=Parelaphostrongylus tenuis TaxID=148309 RepID=A0AAD5MS95_PARTN|nr:hypothetical protein KIN20_019967 [Parelaphostrongylus tenuis]